jgi:stage II sporulation protein R
MRAANMKWAYRILTGGLLLLGLLFYASLPAAVSETSVSGAGLIRLHVLANSDSEADQALKRKVRDEIIEAMAPEFLAAGDIDSARQIARANLDRIELIARRTIQAEGMDYPVTAELDTFPFPTKHYGAFVLPAGDYEAVRVVIGSGGGTNWWCVLFPPLCFVDMTRFAAINTFAMSVPSSPAKPDLTPGKQPAQTLDTQKPGDASGAPEASMQNEQRLEECKTPAAIAENVKVINEVADDDVEDCKVIFSFRLLELFRRL